MSYPKKDGRGHARPSFFWCDNDKEAWHTSFVKTAGYITIVRLIPTGIPTGTNPAKPSFSMIMSMTKILRPVFCVTWLKWSGDYFQKYISLAVVMETTSSQQPMTGDKVLSLFPLRNLLQDYAWYWVIKPHWLAERQPPCLCSPQPISVQLSEDPVPVVTRQLSMT